MELLKIAEPTDALWFGTGWKTQKRHLERLTKDMDSKVSSTEDQTEKESLVCAKKQVDVALLFLSAFHQDGMNSEVFAKVMGGGGIILHDVAVRGHTGPAFYLEGTLRNLNGNDR